MYMSFTLSFNWTIAPRAVRATIVRQKEKNYARCVVFVVVFVFVFWGTGGLGWGPFVSFTARKLRGPPLAHWL